MKIEAKWKQLTEDLVAYGLKKGADQVMVQINEGNEFSVQVLNGKIEKLMESGAKTAQIKVIKAQRVMNASTSDLSVDTLHGLIERSIQKTTYMNPDPFCPLPEKQALKVDAESLHIYDDAVTRLTPQQKIGRAVEIEKIAMADKRVKKSFGAYVTSNSAVKYLSNSNGFSHAYRKTSLSSGITLQAGEGDNLIDEGKSSFTRQLKNHRPPEELAKEAVHRVTRMIGAEKIKTQDLPVVFEKGQAGVILGFLNTCVNGENVFRKQSFLVDQLGKSIAGKNISVIDDGLIPGAPGTKPFDGEGVPVSKTLVVENGVLKSFLLSTYAARKLKMVSTGNASGANNLYLKPGDLSPDDIIKTVDKGLLLTDTMAFGMNSVTGDISKGCSGLLIEKGEITRPVAEITFSGNLGEILNNITQIGNDLEYTGSIVSPTFLVAGLTIGGK